MTKANGEDESVMAVQPGYSKEETEQIALQWTQAMWNADLWRQVTWLGVPVMQWPTDLLVMQELIAHLRPKVIIETGLYLGGTAVYYASLLELLRINGKVISIDIQINPVARQHVENSSFASRIHLLEGDSKSEAVHRELEQLLGGEKNVLVCLDSDHSYQHTLGELRAFERYIPVGGYLVLFDTICEALATTPKGSPDWVRDSPMAALRQFLSENPNFSSDETWGKLLVTFLPKGFLRRTG